MKSGQARSSWVKLTRARQSVRMRLICLPSAGGGASRYREWPNYLPDDMEVVSIQLPGREDRFGEPTIDSMELLTGQLLDGLAGWLDRPFALFGHSMGAFIAFELAAKLRPLGLEPVHFFAAGCRAPHLPATWPTDRHVLPDYDFIGVLRDLNGVPRELLENTEWMDLMLPALRGDFKLVETYRYRPKAPLRCPLSVFGGLQDKEVTREGLEAWVHHTTGPFEVHVLPGDHFFVGSSRSALLQLMSQKVGGVATSVLS
jgi:medium-chain acyl-[acyl-carrier-protein] hydrolase